MPPADTDTRHGGLLAKCAAALRRLFGASPSTPGQYWEKRAAKFLRRKGYRILARNVRCRRGEIDIIAADGDETVFVEVKQRSSDSFGGGAAAISAAKRARIVAAAKEFIAREGLFARPCRFDVVIIDSGVVPPRFDHIENAFGEKRP